MHALPLRVFASARPDLVQISMRMESAAVSPYGTRSYGQRGADGSLARDIVLEDGQQLQDIDVQFEARHVISGTVFDEHGAPADGAIVSVAPLEASTVRPIAGGFPLTVASPAVTDERGTYRIFAIPGVYRVSATFGNDTTFHHPGHTSAGDALPVDLQSASIAPGVDIVMGRALRVPLRGTVTTSSGRPATGGSVRLTGTDPRGAAYPLLEATIDASGRFVFAGVAPGEYTLSAVTRPAPYVLVRSWNGQPVDATPAPVAEYGSAAVTIGVGTPTEVSIGTAPASSADNR